MGHFLKYILVVMGMIHVLSVGAQQVDDAVAEGQKKVVTVDASNPDAVVLEEPKRFAEPIKGLKRNEEVEVLEEENGAYVKVRVRVGKEWKEGWVRKSILGDEAPEPETATAAEAEDAPKSVQAIKGSTGMDPINPEGMEVEPQQNPWQQIDPISPDAKIVSKPAPYYLIVPGALIVAGGTLAAILAATSDEPDPDVPITTPGPEDPDFSLINDAYNIVCGQTLSIFPLLNDEGTGLSILELNDAPEGVQLVNDSTIFISSTLSGDVSFTIDVEDAVGQFGTSTITITIEEIEIAANGEVFELNSGDVVSGNVLQNDLCFGCIVTDVSGNDSNLAVEENGDFEYNAPDDFSGEAVYTVTIENPCGAQDSSDVVFIVNPQPPCSFEWGGNVQVVPAECGLSNGAAMAAVELSGVYQFSWSNGVEIPENEDIGPGSYELIVTDTTFGCTDTLIAEVGELPADYSAAANIIEGGCGESDNVQLTTNAAPDNVLTISLSGASTGIIESVTTPSILLGDFIDLNPGMLTITIWSEQQGAICTQVLDVIIGQGPPLPEVVIAEVVQPQPPENVGTVVLDLVNAALPADVFVNGEFFTTALAPQVVLEGLPPGAYLISVVDFEGCESLTVEVILEGQGIHPLGESLHWSPQTMGLNNWINAPAHLLLQTKEGQDYYTLVTNPTTIPIYLEWTFGNWKFSGAYSQSVFRSRENGITSDQQASYFEFGAGTSVELLHGKFGFKVGYSEWQIPHAGGDGLRAGFVEGVFGWPIENLPGKLNFGLRAGVFNLSPRVMVVPRVQWTFGP